MKPNENPKKRIRLQRKILASVLVSECFTVQPRLEAHNICDNVRQSDFLSLEEKFLPVCAGLAHCKDVGVETDFVFFLSGAC